MSWVTKSSTEQYTAEPARRYTGREKAANWWHYYRWPVVIGVVAAALLIWQVVAAVTRVRPDYQIGWVGKASLPQETVDALQDALARFGTDLNGDGQVVVQLNQYTVDLSETDSEADPYNQMAGVTRLSADLSEPGGSYLFLLEDPAGFQATTEALEYTDGTLPEAGAEDWQDMVLRWADCPVLAGLDLGTYTNLVTGDTGSSQDLLADVYVARRAARTAEMAENQGPSNELWDILTAAAPMGVQG